MTIKELIELSRRVVSGRMHLERSSRFYGAPVFKQKKNNISIEEIQEIQERLYEQGIFSNIEESPKEYILKLARGKSLNTRKRYGLHVFLLLLTILTTAMTGAMLVGKNPFESFDSLSSGIKYSFALMTILFFHEMGHYLYSRKYKVDASLPYFIPLFMPFSFHPGTLGAFIRMRSPIPHKTALFDIGIAGPLAGFVLSIVFLTVGFATLPDESGINAFIETIHPLDNPGGINLTLGNTLLYDGIASLFGGSRLPMNEMYHFPFIFAGWFGLLVTAINLMPIGQLDGGHITYALFGERARKVAMLTFMLLIFLNVYLIYNFNSYIWVLWLFLIFFFVRFRHPPTLNDAEPINIKRRILGWISYIIFILCFSPMPIFISING